MCRNIKTLFNFDPPATDEEIRAASLRFVRKLSGFNAPSKANEAAFNRAIDDVEDRQAIDRFADHDDIAEEPRRDGGAGARARGGALWCPLMLALCHSRVRPTSPESGST